MTDLRRAAERLLEALDDGWIQRDDWVAFELRQAIEQTKNQMPTTLCGPNLEQILNAAGFYKQREWVGLTDDESSDIYNAHHNTYGECITSAYELVLDVEAQLKERNT